VWVRPNWRFAPLKPERFGELARGWRDTGVGMIGGCCGIGPAQIAALSELSR
jgi:S-methylmethionine-dependent homocysteine/selenocysteine methylase